MNGLNLPGSKNRRLRVLGLGAHSDDLEIGCGGLILQLTRHHSAVDVTWVVFSASGQREREARRGATLFLHRAARKRIVMKQFPDGFFPYEGARIKREFEALKATENPDLVLTHYREDRHQDHRVVSDLTWNTFRDHLIFEYEIPKFDGDLGIPNCFVPLERDVCRRKAKFLNAAFGSQRNKHWFSSETFYGLMRLRGMECRARDGFAEAFYARKVALTVSGR